MTDLQNTVTTATAPYVAPDAAPDTAEWFLHTAAVNLRQAVALFEDCRNDMHAGAVS
ncbi:hypothetical protein [Corynebacterium variabile]|uniref:hypothetical protein n=1 Tax=Corynebacterium variabile TaxID=1727 RepID=UPI003FCF75B0